MGILFVTACATRYGSNGRDSDAKKTYPVLPLKVEYHLTSFGQQFIQLLNNVEKLEKKISKSRNRLKATC